ncbi:hypothetical protein [Rubinisphaera margarita]|uniref:hypothetical protein n=1 Tax=Rubinisphaera margarita TaxID=2909586 RepID=UPI001EE7FAF4|nr:hypothetical protein [Rubinisphaera margarita]MCG6157970.1 hypothetical protein [Rubinisphaera margarita]
MDDQNESLLQPYLGKEVVLDLESMYVCVGTLLAADHRYLILEKADLHDLRDTSTTRERYILDSKVHGIRANRERVLINRRQVVGLSLLDDVIA